MTNPPTHVRRFPHMRVLDGTPEIDGAPLITGSMNAVLDDLQSTLPSLSRPNLLVTANVDQVLLLNSLPAWRRVFSAADVRTADGMPIVVLARLLGSKNLHRITGADLLIEVCRRAASGSCRVALVGGTDEVRDAALRVLRDRFEGIQVEGFELPILRTPSDPSSLPTVFALRAYAPDFAFLCLGAPKQELWYDHWKPQLPAAIFVGSGASMDFVAGSARRAPRWLQRIGLEWMFRLTQEPKRLAHRYLIRGPRFIVVVFRSLVAAGLHTRRSKSTQGRTS